MLRDVSHRARIVVGLVALAGVTLLAPLPSAAPLARPAAVHPPAAASNSTRRATHVTHHRRHARAHHTEPNLRANEPIAASQPARVPPRPHATRTSHRTAATVTSHRDGPARAGGAAGVPVTAAGTLSIAVLGACVHQRTRDRLRSISQPLESRGPPRAGPFTNLASRCSRAARESAAGPSAPHPPLGGSPTSRVSPSPLRVRPQ